MRKVWHARWFILVSLVFLFFAFIGTKVMAAPTDSQLTTILGKGLEAFGLFLDWLLEVFKAL